MMTVWISCGDNAETKSPSSNTSTNTNSIDSASSSTKTADALSLKVENYPPTSIQAQTTPTEVAAKWRIAPGVAVGFINKKATLSGIQSKYGAENIIKDGVIGLGKGKNGQPIRVFQTLLYKDQPDMAIIYWSDTAAIKNPIQVRIVGNGNNWRTRNGISIGTKLMELIQINEKDFYFLGFDDSKYEGAYNGLVADWNGGKVNNSTGVVLVPSMMSESMNSTSSFNKLQKYPTNHPNAPSLGLSVGEMRFTFR